jgi:hypothetical protein
MSQGPSAMHRNNAVRLANAVRKVVYRKTRNGLTYR